MKILRLRNAGLLGEMNLLYGDPTGGFTLHLYAKAKAHGGEEGSLSPGAIILRELGLEVAERQTVREGRDEVVVSTLKPLYPFWTQMELQYGDAETLCWRAHASPWHTRSSAVQVAADGAPPFLSMMGRPQRQEDDAGVRHGDRTNESASAPSATAITGDPVTQGVPSPREENGVLLNVYPLQAEPEKLANFCNLFFNNLDFSHNNLHRPQLPFTPLGTHVYFVVLSTQARRAAGWLLREVGFYVPVLWPTSHGSVVAAVTAPFLYSESDVDAIIDRELNGRTTQDGRLEFPRRGQAEFGPSSSTRPVPLLTVRTEVFARSNTGEADKDGRLLQLAAVPGRARRSAIEVESLAAALTSGALYSLAVKQFPEAEDMQYACYQALVAARWAMDGKVTVRKIEGERILRLYTLGYPQIAETLGLVPLEKARGRGDELFATFPVIEPFSVEIEKQAGWRNQQNVYWRAGNLEWQVGSEGE
jgi:hypothetical protein